MFKRKSYRNIYDEKNAHLYYNPSHSGCLSEDPYEEQVDKSRNNLKKLFDAHDIQLHKATWLFPELTADVLTDNVKFSEVVDFEYLVKLSDFFHININWIAGKSLYSGKMPLNEWHKEPEEFCANTLIKYPKICSRTVTELMFVINFDVNEKRNLHEQPDCKHNNKIGLIVKHTHFGRLRACYVTYNSAPAHNWCYYKVRRDIEKILGFCESHEISSRLYSLSSEVFKEFFLGAALPGDLNFESHGEMKGIISNDLLKSSEVNKFIGECNHYIVENLVAQH